MGKQKEEEEKKDRAALLLQERKKIIYNLVLVVTASIVVVIGILTVAWFAKNKNTNTSGTSVKVGNNGFELRVGSGNIGYETLYNFDAIGSEYSSNSDLFTGSGSGKDIIRWRISGSDDVMKPGTCGALEFEIIPSQNVNPSALVYKIDITAFTADITKNTEGETVTETVNSITEVTSDTESAIVKSAANRLRTHLMFFKSATPNADSQKDPTGYHDFISDLSSFTLSPTDEDHDGVYSATIYWIWPNTFGQIALSVADQRTGVNALLDTTGETGDRSTLTTYLTGSNAGVFFKGSDDYASLLTTLYTNKAENISYDAELKKLSTAYNSADREIGSYINFILLTLTAEIN